MGTRSIYRRGFTLVELLVVIGIIALLTAMLLPTMTRARKQARAVVCLTQLRELGMGFHWYGQAWNSVVPFGLCRVWANDGGAGSAIYWNDFLLGADLVGTGSPNAKMAIIKSERLFYCPINKDYDSELPGIYGGVDHNDNNPGMYEYKWGSNPAKLSSLPAVKLSKIRLPSDFPLLADSTMAITKFPGRGARVWAPNNWAVNANASSRGMLWLNHDNRANVLFADGHAEPCDPARLQRTTIINRIVAGKPKYGISHWCTEKMLEETKPIN